MVVSLSSSKVLLPLGVVTLASVSASGLPLDTLDALPFVRTPCGTGDAGIRCFATARTG